MVTLARDGLRMHDLIIKVPFQTVYLFKVSSRNTLCLNLTIKTPESVSIVEFVLTFVCWARTCFFFTKVQEKRVYLKQQNKKDCLHIVLIIIHF